MNTVQRNLVDFSCALWCRSDYGDSSRSTGSALQQLKVGLGSLSPLKHVVYRGGVGRDNLYHMQLVSDLCVCKGFGGGGGGGGGDWLKGVYPEGRW